MAKNKAKGKEFVTLAQIAQRWGVSHSSVLSLVYSGALVAVDVSTNPKRRSRYIVRVTDLEAFEESREQQPIPDVTRCKKVRVPKGAYIEFFT